MIGPATPHSGHILVVDDESPIREVCRRVLAGTGYSVSAVGTGEEALKMLESREIDFVITDIMMPGSCDGSRLLDTIKQKWPGTDVAIMTGFPSLDTAIPMLKNGACDYLVKPFDKADLLSLVDRCFEKRRLAEELDHEKILRLELQAAYSELQKVEKLKESFLARLSHELRTPFISAFFVLDEIESDPDNTKLKTVFKTLRSRISEVWDLVENLLFFADLKHEHINAYKVPVEPKMLLKGLIDKFRTVWEKKGISIDLFVADAVESINGDPQLLATAFKHLLLNAIQFNTQGGHVQIHVENKGEYLLVTFADEGIGIPADKLPSVFDSFYQVAEYMTREVGGLGLGLAIVRRIIEAHGGTVTVASQVGKGSQFTVVLPAGKRGDDHA